MMPQIPSRWLILLLIEVAISSTSLLAVTLMQSSGQCTPGQAQSYPQIISLDLGLNYGNSSLNLWQHLQLPQCTTLLSAMHLAGWRLHTQTYSFGIFIIGINGVDQSNTAGVFWQWYVWTDGRWNLGPVGASSEVLNQDVKVVWYLASATGGPPPP